MELVKKARSGIWSFSSARTKDGLRIAAVLAVCGVFLFFSWFIVQLAGLMELRTNVREGYWVALAILLGVLTMKEKEWGFTFFKPTSMFLGVVLSGNAFLMLWPERPLLFWVLVVGWAGRTGMWCFSYTKHSKHNR